MSTWSDSTSTLTNQVEDEKHEAQHEYLSGHSRSSVLWDKFHDGWLYQRLRGSPDIESPAASHNVEAHFREHFLSCGNKFQDFERSRIVEYADLQKISARELPKQTNHIFRVLGGFCKLRWRGILRRTLCGTVDSQNTVADAQYNIAQLPCDQDSFEWLWAAMESVQTTKPRPQLLAVPVIPGVVEVIADKRIALPERHRKPDVLPHGILCRQAAFHHKDRGPYNEIISTTSPNANRIMKDMVESITLTPCPWSVVDYEITYHSRE